VTEVGIEPAIFRFIAQHCATAVSTGLSIITVPGINVKSVNKLLCTSKLRQLCTKIHGLSVIDKQFQGKGALKVFRKEILTNRRALFSFLGLYYHKIPKTGCGFKTKGTEHFLALWDHLRQLCCNGQGLGYLSPFSTCRANQRVCETLWRKLQDDGQFQKHYSSS